MTRCKKLMVVGHGQHGKDVFAGFLADRWNLTFQSSSMFVAMRAVWPHLGGDYNTFEEMYEDRRNRRVEWKTLIRQYNEPDLVRLGRELFSLHDIYVGIRDRDEYMALKEGGLFDFSIYVDAGERVKYRDPSFHIQKEDCSLTIFNNGTLDDLRQKAYGVGLYLYGQPDTLEKC